MDKPMHFPDKETISTDLFQLTRNLLSSNIDLRQSLYVENTFIVNILLHNVIAASWIINFPTTALYFALPVEFSV